MVNKYIPTRTNKEYIEDNKEKISAYNKVYSKQYYDTKKNNEQFQNVRKEYREKHKEEKREYDKLYREANKEHYKQQKKEYYQKNKDKWKKSKIEA